MNDGTIQFIPLWLVFTGTVALVLLSILGGILLARFRKKRAEKDQEAPVSTVVGATMGLLAFILAFTFGLTASRFDARKELLLNEVNAIETAFLRTGLIPEPYRSKVRGLLNEYVDLRVALVEHPEDVEQAIRKSERVQESIWTQVAALAEKADLKQAVIASLFTDSINEMFDLQTKRVTVGRVYRIPGVMWSALIGITILSMFGVGYLFGASGRANIPLIFVLALAFSSVITLIADLDQSGSGQAGLIQVSPKPMIDLQKRIKEQRTIMKQGKQGNEIRARGRIPGPWIIRMSERPDICDMQPIPGIQS